MRGADIFIQRANLARKRGVLYIRVIAKLCLTGKAECGGNRSLISRTNRPRRTDWQNSQQPSALLQKVPPPECGATLIQVSSGQKRRTAFPPIGPMCWFNKAASACFHRAAAVLVKSNAVTDFPAPIWSGRCRGQPDLKDEDLAEGLVKAEQTKRKIWNLRGLHYSQSDLSHCPLSQHASCAT